MKNTCRHVCAPHTSDFVSLEAGGIIILDDTPPSLQMVDWFVHCYAVATMPITVLVIIRQDRDKGVVDRLAGKKTEQLAADQAYLFDRIQALLLENWSKKMISQFWVIMIKQKE